MLFLSKFTDILLSPLHLTREKNDWIRAIIQAIIVVLVFIGIFYLVFYLENENIIPTLGTSAITILDIKIIDPLSFFTSFIFHTDEAHLSTNSCGMVIIGIVFFTLYGIKRGLLILILVNLVSWILETIFVLLYGNFLFLYLSFKSDIGLNFSTFNFVPSGVGASVGLVGIAVLSVPLIFYYGKVNWKNFRQNTGGDSILLKFILILVLAAGLAVPLLESMVADLFIFFQSFHFIINGNDPDFLNITIEFIYSSISQFYTTNMGSPYLSHILGMIGGLFLYLLLKSRQIYLHTK